MKFEVTPDEAQRPALAVIKHFRKQRMEVSIERAAWADAPYRTTVAGIRRGLHILVEVQGVLSYGRVLKELVAWLAVNRHYSQFYVATMSDAVLQAGVLEEMKNDGVGLLIVSEEGIVSEHQKARNPALVITPDPTLKYGGCKIEVNAAVHKFNETNRKDGLGDMCDLVERLTEQVGVAACKKGFLKIPEVQFREKDWASQINELARPEAYYSGHTPIVSAVLRDDLHSFRNARNLVKHPASTRREDAKREKQFAERMMQGPRLVAELVSLKRKIR